MARLIIATAFDAQIRERPWLRRLLFRLESCIMYFWWWAFGVVSPERASRAGAAIMRRLGPRSGKADWVKGNLAIAFPEIDEQGIEALARDAWANVGAVAGEYPHLESIALADGGVRLEVVDRVGLETYARRERGAVFFGGHLSNWEVNGLALGRAGVPLMGLYAAVQNEHLDNLLAKARTQLGCIMVSRTGSMRAVIKHLSERGSLGLLADLRVSGGDPVPFFGRDMETSLVPARLALRHGCDLVPMRVERLGPAHFRFTVDEPLTVPALGSDDERSTALAAEMNARIEGWIRERPGDWLCTNRRWDKSLYPHKRARK